MVPSLAACLSQLLEARRRESISRGWTDVPDYVFCSEVGGPLDERNVTRTWDRLRRRMRKHKIRAFRLHDCRHTFATLAIASGQSLRFVADQLGHASPAFTLKTYAHALPLEAGDMDFADFGSQLPTDADVSKRR